MNAEEIVELILKAARESRVFSGDVYRDEPIIRTGRQAYGGKAARQPAAERTRIPRVQRLEQRPRPREGLPIWSFARDLAEAATEVVTPVPEPIARMRDLARRRGRGTFAYASPQLFYEQARLMENYTDDFPYEGDFSKYYPTYEDMTNTQLRGYFTWRARLRAGEAPAAPLSFLFVHIYELLCGVGVAGPEEGLAELVRLRESYGPRPGNEALVSYLAIWIPDYVAYHGLDQSLLDLAGATSPLEHAIAVLDAAEKALLSSASPGTWDESLPGIPSHADLTLSLATASRYRLDRSRVFGAWRDELDECCSAVFARLVDHCRRRRKRGFVDGLFGQAEAVPYVIFRSAVFFDPRPHEDCVVSLGECGSLACRSGRWTRLRPHASPNASAELGDILHEVDRVLCLHKGGLPELKARDVPKYVHAIVEEEVGSCLARRAAVEAAQVHIDRTALVGIRAAASRTREALLVDEERDDAPEPLPVPQVEPELPERFVSPGATSIEGEHPFAPATSLPGLSDEDLAFLRDLLDGRLDEEALRGYGIKASLFADHINEALLDEVGDTVIEFDGDVPRLVEDYEEDVRKALG